jgi:transposase
MLYVGIDVAKVNHVCAVIDAEAEIIRKPFAFTNDKTGFAKLGGVLASLKDDLRIGFEATGHYGTNLKLYLEQQGYEFMECQPSLVNEFIKTLTPRKTKTDPVNAVQISEYMLSLKPKYYRPVPKNFYNTDCLKRLTRFRSSLVHQRSNLLVQITNVLDKTFPEFKPLFGDSLSGTALYILKNYGLAEKIALLTDDDFEPIRKYSRSSFKANDFAVLRQTAKDTVGESNEYLQIELDNLLEIFDPLDYRVDKLDKEIKKIVDKLNPPCYSIKGVGATTAAVVVAELGDFSRFERVDKALAFAGMDPGISNSGKSEHDGNMSKSGSRYLRETLMNVVSPLTLHNPTFSAYYYKKRSEGKSHHTAASHTAKKLLRVIFALHKQNVTYDPSKLR